VKELGNLVGKKVCVEDIEVGGHDVVEVGGWEG